MQWGPQLIEEIKYNYPGYAWSKDYGINRKQIIPKMPMKNRKYGGKSKKFIPAVRKLKLSSLSKFVKRVVRSQEETKTVKIDGTVRSLDAAIVAGTPNSIKLFPSIPLGSQANQRIGTKIEPRGLYVKGVISMSTASSKVFLVRIMMVQNRNKNPPTTMPVSSLLKSNTTGAGVGTLNVSYDGSQIRHLFPVNKDAYMVYYDKTVKICSKSYYLNAANTDTQQTSPNASVVFGARIPCPETLAIDDATGLANGFDPYLLIGFCDADGNGGVPTEHLNLVHTSTLYFADA